jgi:hypothetical protein
MDYTANAIDWKVIKDAQIGREILKITLPQGTHKTQNLFFYLCVFCVLCLLHDLVK